MKCAGICLYIYRDSLRSTMYILHVQFMINVKSVQDGPSLQTDITVNEIPITFQVDILELEWPLRIKVTFFWTLGKCHLPQHELPCYILVLVTRLKCKERKWFQWNWENNYLDLPLIIVDEKGSCTLIRLYMVIHKSKLVIQYWARTPERFQGKTI